MSLLEEGRKGLSNEACLSPVPVTKIGRCPWVQAPLFPHLCIEKDTCNNDNQCSNKKKCCFSRCAMRCMDPVIGESTGPEFRTSFKLGTQGVSHQPVARRCWGGGHGGGVPEQWA